MDGACGISVVLCTFWNSGYCCCVTKDTYATCFTVNFATAAVCLEVGGTGFLSNDSCSTIPEHSPKRGQRDVILDLVLTNPPRTAAPAHRPVGVAYRVLRNHVNCGLCSDGARSLKQGYEQILHGIRSALEKMEWLNGYGHLSPTAAASRSRPCRFRPKPHPFAAVSAVDWSSTPRRNCFSFGLMPTSNHSGLSAFIPRG